MLFRPLLFLFSTLLLLFPCSNNLSAQTTTSGGLTGVVSDPSHAVVPDAVVEIRDNTKGTIQATKTDSDGAYRFSFLAPGSYMRFAQGRNHFRSPGFFNTDFAVMKNTKIPHGKNVVLSMGLQFFNFFNHANFGLPDNGLSDGTYGQIGYLEQAPTSILGSTLQANVSPRMIQLKFQLQF